MTITLRRTPNGRILELGCGSNPVVKPACQGGTDCTVDVRTCYDSTGKQTVDFVADFEKELPIQSDEFDSVFCQFALEHISYPNTLKFLKECFRVLKPGGYAVFVTPNTEAQLQWILANPNGWDNKDLFHAASEILFGTLDYPENSHKAFLSPTIAAKLFSEAGFTNVTTDAYNERKTDMVITAGKGTSMPASVSDPTVVRQGEAQMVDQAKSAVMKRMVEDVEGSVLNKDDDRIHGYTREECFDKHYFNGGGKVGGYAREGYWDYPIHWATAHQVMIRRPQSVLELGAARGYVGKKLQDAGIRYAGLEISRHCYMTRACNPIHLLDLCTSKWPVEDQEFDYSFSCAVLEHIPRKYLSHVLSEMKRTCKNHFHGIDFGEKDDGFDKTHCFLAGTNILMADGSSKAIEAVVNGDMVLSDKGETQVTRLYRHSASTFVTIKLNNGGQLTGTPEHPVMINNKGWTKLGEVQPGDEVLYACKEILSDREADTVCEGTLHGLELQGNGQGNGSGLAMAPSLGCKTSKTQKGSLGWSRLGKRGIEHTQREIQYNQQKGTIETLTKEKLVGNSSNVPKSETVPIQKSVNGAEIESCGFGGLGGCLHSWINRWRRMCIYIGSKYRWKETSNKRLIHGEHRQKIGGFYSKEMWGNGVCTKGREGKKVRFYVPFGFLQSEYTRIQSDTDTKSNYSVYGWEESGSRDSFGISSFENKQTKECSNREGGVRGVFSVEKVVSTERHSGMEEEVFNLETEAHTYVAENVLVHNCTLHKKTEWATLFSNAGLTNYEIVNKEDLEIGKIPEEVLHGDGKVKLNLGSHTTMALHGWINLDIGDLGGFANHYGYKYQRHDLKAGLPYGTGAVDMIALQHVLEHFTYQEGLSLLRECRRVLKPNGGVIRLAVPDMSLLTRGYIQNTLAEFDEINDECANSPTSAGKFWTLLHHGHQAAYDAATLTQIMKEANLVPTITDFRKTEVEGVKQILRETLDMHPCISLYADGIPFVG